MQTIKANIQLATSFGLPPSMGIVSYFVEQQARHEPRLNLLMRSNFFGSARRITLTLIFRWFVAWIAQIDAAWREDKTQKYLGGAWFVRQGGHWHSSYQSLLLKQLGGKSPNVAKVTATKALTALDTAGLIERDKSGKGEFIRLTPLGYLCATSEVFTQKTKLTSKS